MIFVESQTLITLLRFRLRNKIKLIKTIFVSDSTDLEASNCGLFKIKPSVSYSTEVDVKTSGENERSKQVIRKIGNETAGRA